MIETAAEEWCVAIYFHKGETEAFHAWIDKMCMSRGRSINNLSACTARPVRMKRWKTKAGARKAAAAYERNNPGSRCHAYLINTED